MKRDSKLFKYLRALRIALIERNKSIIGHYAYKINNMTSQLRVYKDDINKLYYDCNLALKEMTLMSVKHNEDTVDKDFKEALNDVDGLLNRLN